jgi:hypothetical protein
MLMAISLARIKVERNGQVILDGGPVKLAQLRKALVSLKKAKGRIRYYREGSRNEASAAALRVWAAVMDSGLPVDLCDDAAALEGDRFADSPREEKERDDTWW